MQTFLIKMSLTHLIKYKLLNTNPSYVLNKSHFSIYQGKHGRRNENHGPDPPIEQRKHVRFNSTTTTATKSSNRRKFDERHIS